MSGTENGLYFLVAALDDGDAWIRGRYDVMWQPSEDALDTGRYEILDSGPSTAAEWSRLIGERDHLREVAGVMNS